MDDQSLRNVLAILRLLKGAQTGSSMVDVIAKWCVPERDELTILKFASYVMEQTELAKTVILNSQLSEEAKTGVLATIEGVATAFSLGQLQGAWNNHVRDVSTAISSLVILLSALGVPTESARPPDVDSLIASIEEIMKAFDDPALDPAVRDVAQRHLKILWTLLQNIQAVGLEPALTTYLEMTLKLRRADIGTTGESQSALAGLFVKLKGIGEKLAIIDSLWNSGAKLLEHMAPAKDILQYLPRP